MIIEYFEMVGQFREQDFITINIDKWLTINVKKSPENVEIETFWIIGNDFNKYAANKLHNKFLFAHINVLTEYWISFETFAEYRTLIRYRKIWILSFNKYFKNFDNKLYKMNKSFSLMATVRLSVG